jgi:hypothetical protein
LPAAVICIRRLKMLELVYCPEGKAYSDIGLLKEAENILAAYNVYKRCHDGDLIVKFCTGNLINAMCVIMLRMSYDPSHVRFVFKGEVMTVNAKYRLSHWAKGFGSCDNKILRDLSKYAASKRRD